MNEHELSRFWDYVIANTGPKGSQRAGQAMFNALHREVPVLADMVRGTDADPFYDDSRIPVFLERIGHP